MATQYNFTVEQGASFSGVLTSSLNLTNYSLQGSMMPRYGSSGNLGNLQTSVISGAAGIFLISMSPATTSGLLSQRLAYNVKATNTGDGSCYRLYEGYINVNPQSFL